MSSRLPTGAAAVVVTVLLLVGSVGGVAGQSGSPIAQADTQQADGYVVEQGSFCQPIEPLSSGESVESFYEYRSHETHPEGTDRFYSSYGTTHLQRDNTSALFLHEGPEGLSLVTVHGRLDTETPGGLVTYEIAGLPAESEWVVRDDNYTGDTRMDEFDRGDGWTSASWIFRDGRTDGGAIRGGLDGQFAVTIRPGFNEDSAFADRRSELYDPDFDGDGEIEQWDVLSGAAGDGNRRTELPSLEEPVTIRTGTCDDPSVTYERTDGGITARVTDAAPEDRVFLQPTRGTDDGVRFDGVELTGLSGEASIGFESRFSELSGSGPDGVEALSYLTITNESGAANASGTVSFTVQKDRLEELGLEPEEVVLYEQTGDGWTEADTEVLSESDGAYRLEADVTAPSAVAVAPAPGSGSDSLGLLGLGAGLAAGAVIGLGWLATTRLRDR
ncbi:hypothetical protein Natpe_1302 [Natrinema pellirubrum DSM 15624]|uniref:Uncharacterized protein n=1 Tax=Natrinema pellirubrum (strain DSM 15624 / CIP 106293 / JCM 10476 / NCIMB 786 / 157) TaxID=797303 RepID=L0JKV0_NATP1|nr:PGF-pre-PGF domain-containing protein [Natrinema pellirubrum]AGB31207.1 hypothetical protein Natpe_1302 [Natrinema pellirubrum DSM 15624]